MAQWTVQMPHAAWLEVEVDADSKREAIAAARKKLKTFEPHEVVLGDLGGELDFPYEDVAAQAPPMAEIKQAFQDLSESHRKYVLEKRRIKDLAELHLCQRAGLMQDIRTCAEIDAEFPDIEP